MDFPKIFLVAAFLPLFPVTSNAESRFSGNASGPVAESAKLDFQIEVPKVLFLRIGTGADCTTSANVDLITFNVNAANVGDGSAVAATAASGDLGAGSVTAKVLGNNGIITFDSTTQGALQNGSGSTISHNQIVAAATALTSAEVLQHPVLVDGGTTSIALIPASGRLINRDARWTFSYLNQTIVAPGTYGGVNTNNGRVTYTASMP